MPLDDANTEIEPVDDIRSAINAAMAEHETVVAPETSETPDPKPRDDAGKFAKSEAEAKTETETAAPVDEAKTETAKPGTEAPANWSQADKDMFKGLPPEAQGFMLRRHQAMEADYTRKTQAIADFRKEYEPVADAFRPHEAALRQSGYTPQSLIKAWMNVEQSLMSGKGVDVVADIVRGYKIPVDQIAQRLGLTARPSPGSPGEQPPEPQGQAMQLPPELMQKFQTYDQYFAQQAEERRQAALASQRETENRVVSAIEAFKSETGKDGGLLHPHFDDVQRDMEALVIGAQARGEAVPDLKTLYDRAVWANPSTREQILAAQSAAQEAQRAAAERERTKEARAASERARRTGSSITGTIGTGQTAQTKGDDSIKGAILAAIEAAA